VEIKSEFLTASIDHKHLALKIGDDRALVGALRVLFPCDYIGEPIRGYRGTNYRKTRRVHGFSRMRDIEVARRFARDRARPQFAPSASRLSPSRNRKRFCCSQRKAKPMTKKKLYSTLTLPGV
jgi:hypothetical protein